MNNKENVTPRMTPAIQVFSIFLMFLTVLIVAAGWAGYQLLQQGTDTAKVNRSMLLVLLAVSGCTTSDSPAECSARQTDRSRLEGQRRVADVECRIRAALAGKPPTPGACIPG